VLLKLGGAHGGCEGVEILSTSRNGIPKGTHCRVWEVISSPGVRWGLPLPPCSTVASGLAQRISHRHKQVSGGRRRRRRRRKVLDVEVGVGDAVEVQVKLR
jgi:hypothetical protein